MSDRLTGMEVFVRAIASGSLSAAARAMGMSPAMAAKHLDALERRLGVTLVSRTTRKLSLTEPGQRFREAAERMLADLLEAEAAATASTTRIDGLLRVNAPVSFGTRYLAPLVDKFLRQYPDLQLELGLNDRMVDLLDEGWDLAIRIGRMRDSSLIARKLVPVRLVLCAAPAYLAEHGTPRTIADLSSHDCLGYTLAPITAAEQWSFGSKGEILVPVRGSLRANNGDVLLAAAITGRGLLYTPRFVVAAALDDGLLTEITLDVPAVELGAVYAVTHPNRRPTARVRCWTDFLAHEFRAFAGRW